jgi:hypothetical protein
MANRNHKLHLSRQEALLVNALRGQPKMTLDGIRNATGMQHNSIHRAMFYLRDRKGFVFGSEKRETLSGNDLWYYWIISAPWDRGNRPRITNEPLDPKNRMECPSCRADEWYFTLNETGSIITCDVCATIIETHEYWKRHKLQGAMHAGTDHR